MSAMARFLVRRLGGEGLALDLDSGAYYRVAGAAVAIAEGLAQGQPAEAVAARLAQETGIDAARARADVEAVAAALAAGAPAAPGRDPSFAPAEGGLALRFGGREVLRLDGSGRSARLAGDPAAPPTPAERLRWALPHMAWLSGATVLHAAAARLGGGVLALTGASGAGKSTLARLLAGDGPVSDDLLFLRPGPAGPEAVLGGEAAARAWEAREARRLGAGGEARLEPEDLRAIEAGPSLPLSAVWILDAGRREGRAIALDPVPGAEGLGLLLEHSFGETGEPEVWRRILEASAAVIGVGPPLRATVPATLAALVEAARRYRDSSRS